MSVNTEMLEGLAYLVTQANSLSELEFDSDQKIVSSKSASNQETQDKLRVIFQDTVNMGIKYLQSPVIQYDEDNTIYDLCEESDQIVARTNSIQYVKEIINSKIAKEIFQDVQIESFNEITRSQTNLLTKSVAHSLLSIDAYIKKGFIESDSNQNLGNKLKSYSHESIEASKLGHIIGIYFEALGKARLQYLLKNLTHLNEKIEKLSLDDQTLLYQLYGKLNIYYKESPADTDRKILGFIEKVNQFNQIQDEEKKKVLKAWIFSSNAWSEFDLKPLLEFSNRYDLKEIQSAFKATMYQNFYFSDIVKKWFFGLLNEMNTLNKDEFLQILLNSMEVLRNHFKKNQLIPNPIQKELCKFQIELLSKDPKKFEMIENSVSYSKNLLLLTAIDPEFPTVYFKLVNKLDMLSKIYFEIFIFKEPTKIILALKPVLAKLSNLDSPAGDISKVKTAFEKFPKSFHQNLPALLLHLPEKKDFIVSLLDDFPANPEDIKTFFISHGEEALYNSIFAIPKQFWEDFHRLIHSSSHSENLIQWMGHQLLMDPQELKRLTADNWLEISKSLRLDFVELLQNLVSMNQKNPEMMKYVWELLKHNPSIKSFKVIIDHLQSRMPGNELFVSFLLEHPELISEVPEFFAENKFDPFLINTPLPIVRFIFNNSDTKDKFVELISVLKSEPKKMAKIVEVETKFSQPLVKSYYNYIDGKDLDAILRDSPLQEYLKEGGYIPWKNIPKEIYDIAPDLPLKLIKLLKQYQLFEDYSFDDKELFEELLKLVVRNRDTPQLVQRLVDLSDQYKNDSKALKKVLPKNTLTSFVQMCKSGNASTALELFNLMYGKKGEKVNYSFLENPVIQGHLIPLIEAIANKYKNLKDLPTLQEKLQNLPIEWKSVLSEFIEARLKPSSMSEEAFKEVLKNPTLYSLVKLTNRKVSESKSTKLRKSFYSFNLKDPVHNERVNKVLTKRFYSDISYESSPDLYIDWFERFPFHPGLGNLFQSKNKPLLDLLQSLDYSQLDQTNFRENVLTLAQLNEWEALSKIVTYLKESKDEKLTLNLLDLTKAGYVPEAVELLNFKEKKQISPLEQKLLHCANSSSGEWIQRILALRDVGKLEPEIEDILASDFEKSQFNSLQKSLILLLQENQALHMQRLMALIKKNPNEMTEREKKILYCYSTQSFEGAELFSNPPSSSWDQIATTPMELRLVIPFIHLLKDCDAAGKVSAWKTVLPFILSDAPVETKLEKMGLLQYLLVFQPDQIPSDFMQWKVDPLGPVRSSLDKLSKAPIDNANDKAGALETELAFQLAKMLTTASGQINTGLIPLLIANIGNDLVFPTDSDAAIYLKSTLQNFAKEPKASEILSQILPAQNLTSPSTLVVKKMFGIKDSDQLLPWHAQVAALSALLYRTRQGNIGSCYATSFAILIQSDTQNLLQSLKDYKEIILKNELKKSSREGSGLYSYPMNASQKRLKDPYPIVNPLVREREILISRMSGVTTNGGLLNQSLILFDQNNQYENALKQINLEIFGKNILVNPQTIADVFRTKFLEKTKGVMEYDIPDPVTGKLGHWTLERRDGHLRITNMEEYLSLHVEVINEGINELINQFPDLEEYYSKIRQPLIQKMVNVIRKTANTTFWSQGPKGGFATELRATYHQLSEKSWPEIELPAENCKALINSLFQYIQSMPLKTRERIEKEPEVILDLVIPSHAVGLIPYPILNKINNGITPDKMIEQLTKPSSIVMAMISEDDREKLIQKISKALPSALEEPFKMEMANWADIKAMSLTEFGQKLLSTIEAMNGGKVSAKVQRELHKAFYTSLPESIKEQIPKLMIADFNWNSQTEYNNYYLVIAQSLLTGELDYFITNRRGSITGEAGWNIAQNWTVLQPLSRYGNGRLTYKKQGKIV